MSGMKPKTINAVIAKKMEDWLKSIKDDELRKEVKKDLIVTGGCIASMFLGEKINDFDIYFKTKKTTANIARYYLERFKPANKKGIPVNMYIEDDENRVRIIIKSAGIASEEGTDKEYQYFESRPDEEAGEYISDIIQDPGEIEDLVQETKENLVVNTKPKYRPVFVSTNAITLSDKIQVVLRFYGEPDDIHEYYDFAHVTNYWTYDTRLIVREEALTSLLSRSLVYGGSKYPVCSLFRIRKFLERGWTINAGQILKMAMQVSNLDLNNVDVLEDQLTGVDVAYFAQLITAIRATDKEKVETAYVVEIIDRMF